MKKHKENSRSVERVANVEMQVGHDYNPCVGKPAAIVRCDLMYPPRLDAGITDESVRHVEISLVAVRSADSIRVSYDYDRDGWVIEQASRFFFGADDSERDSDWQEVAFVDSCGREEPKERTVARLGFSPFDEDN